MRIAALLSALLIALAVPAMAQNTSSAPPRSFPAAKAPSQQTAVLPSERRVDLNSASESDLDSLPGIGKARADAIVKNRPYHSPQDLVTRHIIPPKVYDGLKDSVVAR